MRLRKAIRNPWFWVVLQKLAYIGLIVAAWNEPPWRFFVILVAATAMEYTEARFWRARRARRALAEASDV